MDELNEVLPQEESKPDSGPKKCRLSTVFISSIACLIAGALIVLIFVPNALRMRLSGSPIDKLTLIGSVIDDNYIDAEKLDKKELTDMAALGYVYGLGDQYSTYYDAETYNEVNYSNRGGSHGIGINVAFYEKESGMYVVRVNKDSPADAAGIKAGDVIIAVDGKKIDLENYEATVDSVRGDKGTQVKLTVKRDGKSTVIPVTRGDFTAESVYSRMIGRVGLITITGFNDATDTQFADALDRVLGNDPEGLIFDVRGNSGGLVDVANSMLDKLLGEGEIGYAVYKGNKRRRLGWSDKEKVDLPMVVLTDARSASSAEYFASALRDSAGAKLVGGTTFGKAVMQTTYMLGDGSALRITVARVYTESGTDYNGKGLKPDVEVEYTEEQAKEWYLLSDSEEPYISAALQQLKSAKRK